MSIVEAIILGIIQGLTEFLPVSSSGHIELGKVILGVQVNDPLLFSIVVHGATALSTIVVFRKTIANLIRGFFQFKWNDENAYLAKIVVSMIPVGVIGVLFEEQLEQFFEGEVLLVGLMLLITGGLLYLTAIAKERTGQVSFKNALIIGLAQAVAILPGISRSGATISTALLVGVNREKAAAFSFLMVLPPILGALLIKSKKYWEGGEEVVQQGDISLAVLLCGFVAAFLSGLIACNWMISLVKNSKLQYFAYYCFVVGAAAILYTFILA